MASDDETPAPQTSTAVMRRRTTRRAVLGGGVAAAGVVGAYAAFGDPLSVFGGGGSSGGSSSAPNPALRADTAAISQESVKISHLLRRTGFGVTGDELQHFQSQGLKASIDELVSFKTVDDSAAEKLADDITAAQGQNQNQQNQNRQPPISWWLTRIVNTKRPLQEKMVLFWHGLLTSQISVVRDADAMRVQNEFYRTHAFDAFPTILKGISADPAMMVYLNLDGSQSKAPNENYARELMELYALGVGNYTEKDVREAARAFSGWQVQKTRGANPGQFTLGEAIRRPTQVDNGAKTFLGKTGNFRPDDIVDIITEQPASAKYIVRRLFSFFVYPEPSDADIQPFVDVYTKNDKNIGAVVEAMLRSDVFYSPKAYRAIVKSPTEFAVSAIKALGLQGTAVQQINGGVGAAGGGAARARQGGVLGAMGQTLFEPPNVAGWPGNGAWLNSSTLLARLNFLNSITGGAGGRARNVAPAADQNLGTASQALSHYLPLALDDNLKPEARQVFLDYAGGPDTPLTPEKLRGLTYLILGSPQFNLA